MAWTGKLYVWSTLELKYFLKVYQFLADVVYAFVNGVPTVTNGPGDL